ncbi:mechanosensitive ion channel family protein [Smaragdicoccus niigatensis]|uniref:mechanosensitive ion channel family protein n=1 Tax=Smaragdicoccus niigatensis TaxID=359359 RepID=UPI00037D7F06|nr:mechanosensitive ion channel domain-containing protein [Smaragdicoccus niigatensis]
MNLAIAPLTDFTDWLRSNGLEIVLLVLGAAILSRFVVYSRNSIVERIDKNFQHSDALVRSEAQKHRRVLAMVISWVVLILIYVLVAIQVLQLLGFEVVGLVAPATVIGAAVGFGAQKIVQDILAGFFIITERQYGFGDAVSITLAGNILAEGTVEDVTLRVTRVRSNEGEVIVIPNGQIVKSTNLSKDWARAVVDVPVPTSADITQVNEILHDVGAKAFADKRLRPLLLDEPSVMGIESLEVDKINIRMVARTLPGKQFQVSRELRVRVAAALRREGHSSAAAAVTVGKSKEMPVGGSEE